MRHLLVVIVLGGCAGSEQAGVAPIVGCQSDSDCLYGFYCQGGGCQQTLRSCASSVDCMLGESCQSNPAPGCLDASSGLDCPAASVCLPADLGFCCACQTDADCALGGYCVSLDAGTVCTSSCTPIGCASGSCCPTGSSCGTVEGADGGELPTCVPDHAICPSTGLSCS